MAASAIKKLLCLDVDVNADLVANDALYYLFVLQIWLPKRICPVNNYVVVQ